MFCFTDSADFKKTTLPEKIFLENRLQVRHAKMNYGTPAEASVLHTSVLIHHVDEMLRRDLL